MSLWYGALMYGYNPMSVVYFATWREGHLYLRTELTFKGALVSDVAQRIKESASALGIRIPTMRADPRMDEGRDEVETTMQTFRRFGVPCVAASASDAARVQGWHRLRAWLAKAPDGRPWLIVHPDCTTFIESMNLLVADPRNRDDVMESDEDDDRPATAVRYLVEALQPPALAVPIEAPHPDSIAALRARFAPTPSVLRPYVSAS